MPAYLVDTNVLTVLLDAEEPRYTNTRHKYDAIVGESDTFICAVTLGELRYGLENMVRIGGTAQPVLRAKLRAAEAWAVLDFTTHTAEAYGMLKAILAHKYLRNTLRSQRPSYVENWIDQATGQMLGVDENDLWICAHAKERDLIIVTTDRMRRIQDADPDLHIQIL